MLSIIGNNMVYGLLNCISFRRKKENDDDNENEEKILRSHKIDKERAHLQMIQKILKKGYEPETEYPSKFDTVCVVCYEARASVRCFPCGHRVSCRRCASVHVNNLLHPTEDEESILKCFVCREEVIQVVVQNKKHIVDCVVYTWGNTGNKNTKPYPFADYNEDSSSG
uniref:RING-type domain-containing protein n=1 Tax=Parastrongyloides trichosuri TaxID=131310 RepID=A0A0N4ZP05_PARTI